MPRNRHLGREEYSGGPKQRTTRSHDGRAKSIAMSPHEPDADKQLSEGEYRDRHYCVRRVGGEAAIRVRIVQPHLIRDFQHGDRDHDQCRDF